MIRTVFIALMLTISVTALAQTPPGQSAPSATAPAQTAPAPKIDPVKEADIRKLLEISGNAKLAEDMVATSMEQLRMSILKSLPEGERSQRILDSFLRRYKARFTSEQLTALIIPIYDKNLTDEDIKGLIDFYQSPLGQRAVKALPAIAREAQQAGFEFGQKVVQQVVKEVQDEFPELKQGQPPEKP
jgi:uncharacterized protein